MRWFRCVDLCYDRDSYGFPLSGAKNDDMDAEVTSERFTELSCLLGLSYLRGIGRRTIHSIAARNRALSIPLRRFFEMTKRDVVARYDLPGEVEIDLASRTRALDVAQRLMFRVLRAGVQVLTACDDDYPASLLDSLGRDAPPVLYLSGNGSLLSKPGIAVVGTRSPSARAKRATSVCAGLIAAEGFNLVSGYADGIDTIAHRAALEADGSTSLVLPYGILRFAPKPDFPVEAGSDQRILIVSEFNPDAPLSRHTALTRNRTICALANAVLVVETRERGGAVNAGRNALRLQKRLFVAAGPTLRSTPAGNRLLMREGAKPSVVFGPDAHPDLSALFDAARSRRVRPQLNIEF